MTALDERAEFVAMKLGFSDDKDPEAFSAAISELLWIQREARNAALEEVAKIAEAEKPVSREECPDHWSCYETAWSVREFVATSTAEKIRALKEPA